MCLLARFILGAVKLGGVGGVINNSSELEIGVPVPVGFVIFT